MLTYRTEVKEVSVAAKRWSWITPHNVYELIHALYYSGVRGGKRVIGEIPEGEAEEAHCTPTESESIPKTTFLSSR
ncbi:hypothetical protein LF817_12070 [Halobacillus sp. A1]|uniref:hypothetical protein n=1 Tax=Halobacillus sp. A1 TaxID=2880262 RepID=UPI0020A65401|nr:hypothetical protein [Halobacillus sp. A1]MCP3032083.1 hypothetical protein [Halobacillus sp. A1]